MKRKRAGYIDMVSPKERYEADTYTCKHCNRAWIYKSTRPGEGMEGGWCLKCNAPICPTCADKGHVMTFEEKLDKHESEQRQKLFRDMGI